MNNSDLFGYRVLKYIYRGMKNRATHHFEERYNWTFGTQPPGQKIYGRAWLDIETFIVIVEMELFELDEAFRPRFESFKSQHGIDNDEDNVTKAISMTGPYSGL